MVDQEIPQVLIVDDMKMMRHVIKNILNELGYKLAGEVQNGQDAVDFVKTTVPDIVLLDINMPKKNGFEALREIMTIDDDILVIMLTSLSDMDIVTKCLDYGAGNYILKDNDQENIKQTIKETWEDFIAE